MMRVLAAGSVVLAAGSVEKTPRVVSFLYCCRDFLWALPDEMGLDLSVSADHRKEVTMNNLVRGIWMQFFIHVKGHLTTTFDVVADVCAAIQEH